VLEGATSRVRKILTTVVSNIGGLLLLLWVRGLGAGTLRRIAAPVAGGLATAMVLDLLVSRAVYSLWRECQIRRGLFPRVVLEGSSASGALS